MLATEMAEPKMSRLPINLEDLLRHRTVERDRIEYKAGWNPDAIVRTLCTSPTTSRTSAADTSSSVRTATGTGSRCFPQWGYRITGSIRFDGASRPLPLDPAAVLPDVEPGKVEGRNLIVLWAPGGQNRPYKAPKEVTAKHKTYHYYIRRYSSTVEAKGDPRGEMLSLTATVPFDDR